MGTNVVPGTPAWFANNPQWMQVLLLLIALLIASAIPTIAKGALVIGVILLLSVWIAVIQKHGGSTQ